MTADTKQANARRLRPFLIVLFAAIPVGIVVLVVIVNRQSDDGLSAQEQAHAITQRQFDNVPLGITRTALEQQLGKRPTDQTALIRRGWVREGEFDHICTGNDPTLVAYFAFRNGFHSVWFGFCFDGDTLKWKSPYSFGD